MMLKMMVKMSPHRLLRICLERLCNLDQWPGNRIHFNWLTQLKLKLALVGMEDVIYSDNSDRFDKLLDTLVERYSNHYLSLDVEAVLNSKYNIVYKNISTLGLGEQYLQLLNCLAKRRVEFATILI